MTFTYFWFCFEIEKEDTEENSEYARKTQQGNNLDEELKDKYETRVRH